MKAILILTLVLLSACGQQEPGANEAQSPAAGTRATAGTPAAASDAAAQLEQRVQAAMAAALQKPDRARYADLRPGATGSICGSVDPNPGAKGGGLRPFVVTPEGIAVISMTPQIMFDEPGDIFPDYYIRWCASPDELAALGPRVNAGGRAFPPGLGEDIPDLGPIEVPPLPTPAEAPAPAEPAAVAPAPAKRAETPPPPGEDSFSKAVIRNKDESKAGQ